MERIDILRRLLELRNDGVEKEDRIFLVEEEIGENVGSCWDPDEMREVDVPDERYA